MNRKKRWRHRGNATYRAGVAAIAVLALLSSGCRDDGEQLAQSTVESLEGVPLGTTTDDGAGRPGPGGGDRGAGGLPTWTPEGGAASTVPTWTPEGFTGWVAEIPPSEAEPFAPPVGAPAGFAPPPGIPYATPRPPVSVGDDGPPERDPEIEALMSAVSTSRLVADVRSLARVSGAGTAGDSDGGEAAGAATLRWLESAFQPSMVGPGSQIVVQREGPSRNAGAAGQNGASIVATLTGIGRSKRLVYAAARLAVPDDAPSTENEEAATAAAAEAVASLLELNRVLGNRQWDASIRFVTFTGGGQGAGGSAHHAQEARKIGLPIVAVLETMTARRDSSSAADGRPARVAAFAADADESSGRGLARWLDMIARRYGTTAVTIAPSGEQLQGVDHPKFTANGFAALGLGPLVSESVVTDGDAPPLSRENGDFMTAIAKLQVAALANLALAPSGPAEAPAIAVAAERPGVVRVTWDAADGGDIAGYWLAWRPDNEEAWRAWRWTREPTAELTELPVGGTISVAVAAANDRGHTSLFSPETSGQVP